MIYCECETVSCNYPSARDAYQPAEQRIPNPLCPRHAYLDDLGPGEYGDPDELLDMYGAAYDYDRGEWIRATGFDEETGDPIPEEGEQ